MSYQKHCKTSTRLTQTKLYSRKFNKTFCISINIILLLVCAIFLYHWLYSRSLKPNQLDTTTEFQKTLTADDSTSQQTSLSKTTDSEPISTEETSDTLTTRNLTSQQLLFIHYIIHSITAIKEVYSKINLDLNPELQNELNSVLKELIKHSSFETYNYIELIDQETNNYLLYINKAQNNDNNNNKRIQTSYITALFRYFRIIKLSYDTFELDDMLTSSVLSTYDDNDRILAIRFALEQLLLKPQLKIILRTSDYFLNAIYNLLFFNNEHKSFNIILENVFLLFQFVVKQIIVDVKENIKINNVYKDFVIDHLIENREAYRRFLILNFYFIYINLFKFSKECIVQEIRQKVKQSIDEIVRSKMDGKNIIITQNGRTIDLVKSCGLVFLNIGKIPGNKFDLVFEKFEENNSICLIELNKYINTILE